jgi:Cytochrome C assembly protein
MFDLEQQIQAWRRSLPGTFDKQPEVVEELECHLRDEVQRLVLSGQAPERAWETALQRLGSPQQLAAEFNKLPPAAWLPARLVMLALAGLGACLAWFLVRELGHGKIEPLLGGHVFLVTLGYSAMFAVGALAAWSLVTRAVLGWDARHAVALRAAALRLCVVGLGLTAVGVVLGSLWAHDHLGRYWGWDALEVGALGVLAWYGVMLAWLRWRPSTGVAGMLLGVVGNVVVSLSWFGPRLIDSGLHAYGYSWVGTFLAVFVGANLVFLMLALVPAGWLFRQRA